MRVLTDAGLLPAGYVASALLAHTLPSYYLVLPELPSSRPAVEAASDAPNLTSMVRPRGGAASANAGAPATENAGDAKMAKAVDAVPVDVDATEMLLNLSLIYAEVSHRGGLEISVDYPLPNYHLSCVRRCSLRSA